MSPLQIFAMLERRGVIVTSGDSQKCCGADRDGDGFCIHRPSHPIFVEVFSQHVLLGDVHLEGSKTQKTLGTESPMFT